MTLIVVDASVALKWVVDEVDSDAAARLARHELWAPDLWLTECANALWAKARRRELTNAEAQERIIALRAATVIPVQAVDLLDAAMRWALELDHPVYDCLYLALALRQDGCLVTADRRFVTAVRRVPELDDRIRLLGGSPTSS